MLRINQAMQSGCVTVKLEGRLLGPWIHEVRRVCDQISQPSKCLSMDLAALTFVDALGAELLRELIGRGVKIKAHSSYTQELFNPETH